MASRLAVCIVLVLGVGLTVVGTPTTASASSDVVVDDDGGTAYASIQAAVDAASPGDTVRVRPGTYRERVTVEDDLTLIAPRGATLDGSGLGDDTTAIEIRGDANVVVDGLTITGYAVGISAEDENTGRWLVRNTTIRNTSFIAIAAVHTSGDWRVRNATIERTSTGIAATYSTGDWLVADTRIRHVTEGHGIEAAPSSGAWTLANVSVSNVDFVGVSASYSAGDWRIVDSRIEAAIVGIGALEASGDWSVRGSAIANTSVSDRYDFWQPPLREGAGIHAAATNGSWTVRATRFVDNEGGAVVATGAEPAGDATGSWWGDAGGPDGDDCVGNVDCSEALRSWPLEAVPATPSTASAEPAPSAGSTVGSQVTDRGTVTDVTPSGTADRLLGPLRAVIGLVVVAWFVGRRRS